MAELMDKQGILDELRRRSGGAQQEQTPMMDKQQILDYLRQRSSAQQQGTGTFAPVQQTPSAKDFAAGFLKKDISGGREYLPSDYGTSATVSAGKTGWADYQAQQERYKNQPKQEPKEKSLLDTILEGIAGIGSDTTLPGVGGSQVATMSKEAQANDPTMPRDNWTDDERYAFGYLWNTQRQKAYDYARAVNNAYARQQEEKAEKEAADKASSGFWSGVANTAGAIAAAPLGLADTMKDLIDYGATGHMQEDGQLSPFEWSQAATGGISHKLNEKGGVIDESVPIIGGKGWGDVYSLGTSIVKSITAAYTGGAGQALITNFGPAVASATESAKERGATDEQAMSYGFLSGLAEAAAEMVGVDNLLKLGAADSLKAVMKNLLKQGTTEALEEGLTSVVDNLADNLVLQDKSVLNQRIAAYTEQGMTPEQAKKQAWMDMAGDVIFDMLGGFVSGAASGGLETVVQTVPTIGRKPATPTQSEETAQTEKVPAQAETPTQDAQTAQTPSQPMTPQQAMQETIAEIIGVPSVTQAVESFRQNGKVSNSQAEAIVADDGVFREILEMTGIAPPSTKSESRAAVKQAVAKLAQESVSDNANIASESTGADATIAETVAPTNTKTETDTKSTVPEYSVGAAMPHKTKRSRVIGNSYANATDPEMRAEGEAALKEDPDIGNYSVIPESESLFESEQRTRDEADMQREYDYLMEKRGGWTSADNDTVMKLRRYFYQKADTRFADIVQRQSEEGTQAGQFIQSFAKYTRMTGEDAAAEVVVEMGKLKESDVPKRFYKDGGFEQWKGDVITSSMNIAKQIDSVEDGDVDGMKDIIRSMAKWRKTTAWFGLSSDLSKAAEAAMKDIDFETAKAIANAQLSTLPSDFKKRPVGQVVKTIRIHNMLSALTTINRNLVGNTAVGFIDATSDSTSGRLIDALVSKVTGKRTVGNDIKYGKTYMDAAWKATKMASLCAELDIPMDSESRFTTGTTRTYSPQGNPIMRFMSAYEKYMKYALEVTDQFYQGGANAAVDASLQEISGNGTLTQEEAEAIAKLAGQRRTLKDERAATRMAKKLRQGLNEAGTENIGLGDLTMPFATIGSTSAHVAIDYTAGSVTGLAQVFQLMSDVKKGRYANGVKTIYKNGKPVRTITLAEAQRAAVTNAGRGITGLGLVTVFAGLAAAGILKAHDDKDKDKRGLEQAQNLSGAQLNIDAAIRGLQGKSTDWQNDDLVISVDFLEPFNAQMYLGYLLSQEESVLDAVKSYPKHAIRSVVSSIADMPPMQGMQEALDILSGLQDVGDEEGGLSQWAADSAGQVIGSTASGFIPGWLRQTAQVIDPYYRDTSGDTATDAALNQVKAAIPGLSQTLPKKYSGLGQEQLRDDDWISGIFNTMVNPGDADRIKTTEVTEFLDELYDLTGDLGIYPDAAAPKSFTQDKKTYTISTKEETEIYQKTYGSEVNKLYSELIKFADFQNLDGADQAAVLEKAKEAARALAKSKISKKYTPPSSIKNKPIFKSDAQAILDAYLEAKRKAEKEAQKEAAKEAYLATKNGQ